MLRMTGSACSGVFQPCSPVRSLRTRSSECWPPFQWMTSTISPAASSTSAMISVINARTNRWRVRIVVLGAFRRIGKVDVLRRHPQQHLASAAKLPELLEHQPDHLLQPSIWIEAEADAPVPAIANRHREPQLAALRFRSCRVVHPGADDPQLELADAALHPTHQAATR